MDRKEFEVWLRDLPKEQVVLIAARAAVRVFPVVTRRAEGIQLREALALLTARAILTSGVGVKLPTPEVRQAADAVAAFVANAAHAPFAARASSSASSSAARAAAAVAAPASSSAPDAVADAADAAFFAADGAAADAADAVRAAAFKDVSFVVDTLLPTPIWHDPGEPDWLADALTERDDLLNAGPEWAFWRKWYQGFLNGTHLDWELQRRVALIEENIWEAGPKAVAAEIARIEAAYEVERRAADVEESASTALSERRGIGDNNPPSTIDDALITSDSTTIIWAAAQDLREEALADAPKKSRVVKALSAIVGGLKACGLYVATKVDLALDTVIVETIKAARVIGTGWLALNTETVQNLVQAVVNWLQFLG